MRPLLIVVTVLCLTPAASPAEPPGRPTPVRTDTPGVLIEVYTDRAAFDARLGGPVTVVDFDDVDTARGDVAPFAADRYKEKLGVVVTGTDGQYAGRAFGYPGDYPPRSGPNSYAPGPKNGPGRGEGGFETRVTFAAGGKPGAVAGFGCVFIDADYPRLGPCSLTVYGPGGKRLGAVPEFAGPSGSKLFRGVVTVDAAGKPVAAVQKVVVQNGSGWPQSGAAEGVTLDDFAYSAPVPAALPATETDPDRPVKDRLVRMIELQQKHKSVASLAENQLLNRRMFAIGLEAALAELSDAEAALPVAPEVRELRAIAYLEYRQPEKARAEYEKLAAIKPRDARDHACRAHALYELGRPDEALAAYAEAIRLDPENAGLYHDRVEVLVTLRRYGDGLRDCDRALALEPGNSAAHYNRGVCLVGLNRPDEAFADFTRAIEVNPTPPGRAYFNRGVLHMNAGRPARAVEEYSAAIEIDFPRSPASRYEARAKAYAALGQTHRADADRRRAAELRGVTGHGAGPTSPRVKGKK
jgi:tetratricopeptide (TPR) repeat protein